MSNKNFVKGEQKDYSISFIRLGATLLIVLCHIMQYFDCRLAQLLNVGVQIFLCMSGFLYGKKDSIVNSFVFYKKNFKKIIVDYYIVIIPILCIFLLFFRNEISYSQVLHVLMTYNTLPGGGHLWYIPYCLFCYLITPFLCCFYDGIKEKNLVLYTSFFMFIISLIIDNFISYFNSAWICCYIIGFFLGRVSDEHFKWLYRKVLLFFSLTAFLTNCVRFVINYVLEINFTGGVELAYNKFSNYSHVALGVTLFMIFKLILDLQLKRESPVSFIKSICIYSDKLSYDVYLVHQFVILGPLSLMRLTKWISFNIALILIIIVIWAIGVNMISNKILIRESYYLNKRSNE